MILMARSCAGICNFGWSGRQNEARRGDRREFRDGIHTERPKLRRGTAWSRNKCGLRGITTMRDVNDALADKTVSAKNDEREREGGRECRGRAL